MGSNPVQIEVGDFDEAIEIVEDEVVESKLTQNRRTGRGGGKERDDCATMPQQYCNNAVIIIILVLSCWNNGLTMLQNGINFACE